MCSLRVAQLLNAVEYRHALGIGIEPVDPGQEHALSNTLSQDQEEDPNKVFTRMLALLSEL